MRSGRFVRDIRARVTDAHDQDRTLLELGRVVVLARMELSNCRIELAGEGRARGRLKAPVATITCAAS